VVPVPLPGWVVVTLAGGCAGDDGLVAAEATPTPPMTVAATATPTIAARLMNCIVLFLPR
jgi:hypothetical protein